MIFQNYALMPHLTVAENIAFPLQFRRMPRPALVSGVACQVGDHVAFVMAETPQAALAATETVEVSYESLACVVERRQPLHQGHRW